MIIFVGVSGAGKGTQSEILAREIGYAYLATGDTLRQLAGPEQKARMLGGQLLRDDEMIALVGESLHRQTEPNKVILDGFPRTVGQAQWLLDGAASMGYAIEAVIHLRVDPEVVLKRLRARGRDDDTPNAIALRLAWYEEHTKPVVELFRTSNQVVLDIDGSGTSERVHQLIMNGLAGRLESTR